MTEKNYTANEREPMAIQSARYIVSHIDHAMILSTFYVHVCVRESVCARVCVCQRFSITFKSDQLFEAECFQRVYAECH